MVTDEVLVVLKEGLLIIENVVRVLFDVPLFLYDNVGKGKTVQ